MRNGFDHHLAASAAPSREALLLRRAASLCWTALVALVWAAAAYGATIPEPSPRPATVEPVNLAPPTSVPADSLLARAERALARGEPDLALRIFQDVPADAAGAGPRALYGEGRCWLALGRVDRAARALRNVADLADTTSAGRTLAAAASELLGQTYLQQGRTETARGVFLELGRRFPDRRDWSAVMVGRTFMSEASYHAAFAAIRPVLREGRYAPAYDLALSLYWQLDAGAQRELSRLLQGYLNAVNRQYVGGGR